MGLPFHDQDETPRTPDMLTFAMGIVADSLRTVGPDLVEIVTLTRGRICLQPMGLNRGEQIAHALGCDVPLDHRMFVPGHTLWTGVVEGLEVQVRSALRQTVGAAR